MPEASSISLFVVPITTLAIIGAGLIGLLCGSLGPYLVWKRLGLLGDAVAHASLCVVAFALLFKVESAYVLIPFSIVIGFLLSLAQERNFTELDSVLAIFFAGFMGIGLIIMSISGQGSEEILHVLFGDIQKTTLEDLYLLAVLNIVVLGYLFKFKKQLQLMLLQPELAKIEGIHTKLHARVLLILCAVTVAVCLKLMGVVLVTALFIAPALTSLAFAKSARHHMLLSIILGLGISVTGILVSKILALPSSATIAALGLIVFVMTFLFRSKRSA